MARVLQILRLKHSLFYQTHRTTMGSVPLQEDTRKIFWAAVSAVLPPHMLQRSLKVTDCGDSSVLECGGIEFSLNRNLYLVGFGKAVLGMAASVEQILGKHLLEGVISIPRGMEESLKQAGRREMLLSSGSSIRVMEGAEHNMADEAALEAAGEIQSLAKKLTERDILLVLISGGGSALLPAPFPPLTLQDKQTITKQLAMKGATIQELNTLRRTLSKLKGGGLAMAAFPAQVVSLILSDVIGDDLDVIASGPTVYSSYSAKECLQILDKYHLRGTAPGAVEQVILSRSPTLLNDNFSHVHNILIGSNLIAIGEAQKESIKLGYHPVLLSTSISGDVKQVSRFYGLLARVICSIMTNSPEQQQLQQEILSLVDKMTIPNLKLAYWLQELQTYGDLGAVCVLCGGEITVLVHGEGKGGRNQELALRVAQEWHDTQEGMKDCEVLFLSGGTDGQDGPTEAAGAFSYPGLLMDAQEKGLNVEHSLNHSDSNGFFTRFHDGRYLLVTGLTGTNVMDVQVLLIQKKRRQ
ncbi:glycerate kinase [Pelobates fuscus]|uniref:glycerate kinase n=1 Tax=Pelobates fuscus TaxID=191477 RepID=UPI002FE4B2CB